MEDFDAEAFSKKVRDVKDRRANSKIFCYKCKGETHQKTLFEKGEVTPPTEIVAFDEQGQRQGSAWTIEARIWRFTQCLGCEMINLNVYSRYNPAEDDVPIHHFPTKDFRPFPAWATHLKRDYLELICEIYQSLNIGGIRLPLMGARTLLDLYIVEKIGDVGSFAKKLQRLVDDKYISSSSKDLLDIALEYGHAAIHRNYQPDKEEINGVLDIIENLLHTEALTAKSQDLKKNAPKR